jgi:uncharacterized RDD family membrane protein YckC
MLVRHRVVERIAHEFAASGELERLLDSALASPQSREVIDRVLASDATKQALQRVLAGPEVRAALTSQSAGLAEEVMIGARSTATGLDSRFSLGARRSPASPFGGVASRGAALVVDAFAIVAGTAVVGGAASLVAAVVGGVRPDWLAQTLLSVATVAIAVGYFVVFWQTAGQTPGMRLMGVRVLSTRHDGRLNVWQALLRTIGLALGLRPGPVRQTASRASRLSRRNRRGLRRPVSDGRSRVRGLSRKVAGGELRAHLDRLDRARRTRLKGKSDG